MSPDAPAHGEDAAITLRPICAGDQPFLFTLYANSRERELAVVPWDAARKAAFLQMQFDAQHVHDREHFAGASFDIVLVNRQPAGRLYVARGADEMRVVDIALLPEYGNHGTGTRLIRQLQSEAHAAGTPLRIHVERFNPALRLYERLGFTPLEDRGVYLFLEWRPLEETEKGRRVFT